jgi:phosphotransferase system IIA component
MRTRILLGFFSRSIERENITIGSLIIHNQTRFLSSKDKKKTTIIIINNDKEKKHRFSNIFEDQKKDRKK